MDLLFNLGESISESSLAQIRKHKYMKMVTGSTKGLQPERLPPTENAIKYHSLRVYLQVMQWMGNQLDETKWGWKRENELLVPIMTDKVHVFFISKCLPLGQTWHMLSILLFSNNRSIVLRP